MATLDPELYFATVAELHQKLIARQVSAVELARAFGARLQALGPTYNALALPLTARAVKQAKAVDGDLKRERWRGPLQGIPFGAKDLLSVKGLVTTWGARPYAEQVFQEDATVIQKLEKTGALLIGKLAMVELAGGGGYRLAGASLFGPGLNPWDRTRWSGGSSSGAASAVAAGLAPFALGSETSGSILTPAAFCNVTALRPTYGLVSRHGAMPLAWTLDKIGPMCRSAQDCGLVLAAIAGGDRNDPGSAGKSFYYTPEYARPLADLKMGYAATDFSDWAQPEARSAFAEALAVLGQMGLPPRETALPDFPFGAIIGAIIGVEGAASFEKLVSSGRVDQLADPRQAAGLRAGAEIPAMLYLKAMQARALVQEGFRRIFADYDVLVAPARLTIAPKISEPLDAESPKPAAKVGMTGLIQAGNLAGLPALCLPCGFAAGMPVALQLVGNPFSENTLLAIGREFQKRTDWHRRRPPL
ncbi:MAG TPA: amidase [Solibacterales bacterium]|nr:amidase [Bryobacterales bacterium]